ncbi:restriction endonuclease subunit S [Streptomyces olivaceus]|uniref:restriction endonuclease subunit S n=1 Tax=Streptomyces olivaceus TaxID=47716 RepID=UPI001CCFE5F0|nr:restriction endonuclease subunit S [Streptomyces olivaceus]MBZ6171198.1 restriction endonuclease subunit S [Streptomyces olivaceus]MBZ6178167.1 restriction endonuclease subunit S [Streptomyces olivaceus]
MIATARLGDVAEFIRGITFKPADVVSAETPGSVRCMRTKNVQAEIDLSDVWSVDSSFVKRADQYLQAGDILVSSANSWNLVGKCSWVPESVSGATFGGFISVLRSNSRLVDQRYLYHWFSSPNTQARVRSFGRQTTNISNLDFARCLAMKVPLPDIAEQRRIAFVLDHVGALRAKRREVIDLLGDLAQSIFIKMFGDPVVNPMGLPQVRLTDLGTLDRGVSKHRPRNDPRLLGGKYPLIQTGDVAGSQGYIRTYQSTYSEMGLAQSRLWPAGTLCITIAANIAKTGILQFDACFPDSVVGFTSDAATVEYVQTWLSFLQENLERMAPESAQKNINLGTLRGLYVPNPGRELIEKFANNVRVAVRMKSAASAHLTELDALFSSLQHRAFEGKLRADSTVAAS